MSMENIDLAGVEVEQPPAQPPIQEAAKASAKKNNFFPDVILNKKKTKGKNRDKSVQAKYTVSENETSSVSYFTLVSFDDDIVGI